MANILKTTLIWHDSTGGEYEAEVTVTYNVTRGYAETSEEPACPDSVEIECIAGAYDMPMPLRFLDDEDLKQECYEDWLDEQARIQDEIADMRRADLEDLL